MRKGSANTTLQAVERTLQLLNLLADSTRPRTLHELSVEVGCSTSTAHRMLTTLHKYHLVEKDPVTRRYRLGLGVLRLANARSQHIDLRWISRPHLEALRDECRETVSLFVLGGEEYVCVDYIESPHEIRRAVEIGKPVRLAALGAAAKVMLAYLPPARVASILDEVERTRVHPTRAQLSEELTGIRQLGTARSFAERVPGASALAAAIFAVDGRVVGALTISGPVDRWTATEMDRWEARLQQAALEISRELGFRESGAASVLNRQAAAR